jgi:CO/xanthine dehydrogenase FAD-binding subunit
MAVAVDATEVTVAGSQQEAIDAFGDGADVTVIAGGTIVMPDLAHGRLRPARALLLHAAGMSGVTTAR